jgi:membrane fusion protein, heavy metal efflux system
VGKWQIRIYSWLLTTWRRRQTILSNQWPVPLSIAIGLAVLLATSGNDAFAQISPDKKGRPHPKAGALSVTKIQKEFLTIEPVTASSGSDLLTLPARVAFRPQAQYAVGALVPGRVSTLLVRSGETVKAGAALLTIDSSEAAAARASLDQAATRLANAEIVYKRNVTMVQKGVGLEVEREEAEARLKEARAEHERARHAVELIGGGKGIRVTVRAPADGIIMTIRVAVGAIVAPGGEALMELGDPTRLQIVAQVPEGDLHRVDLGQECEVTLTALAQKIIPARVESINPRVDPESRRAQVYLALLKPVEGLRDGMLAQVTTQVRSDQGIVVPAAAVLIKDGKRRIVYVEQADGSFEAREVQTGRNRDGRVSILKGLSEGERIVVRGALLLDAQAEQLL